MALAVIGAGFGRTGTMSLKNALEMLGFSKCYHMMEVRQNEGHNALWSAAADGVETDWDALFANYTATVDWPSCHFWRQLCEYYPQAKVILTLRDPDSWYDSVNNTIYPAMLRAQQSDDPDTRKRSVMAKKIVLQQTFDDRFADRDYAIAVFEQHIETVKKTIPPECLLVYEPGAGWPTLCDFLELPVPDQPYPHKNSTQEFHAQRT